MASSQTVMCPSCQAVLKLPAVIPAGRRPKCPKCSQSIPLSALTLSSPAAQTPVPPGTGSHPPVDSAISSKISISLGSGSISPPSASASQSKMRSAAAGTATHDFLAPAEQPDEIGRLGKYRILGVLGAGGMGMVFKAEDSMLRRAVALKVMLPHVAKNPTARSRFLREARAQAAVEHDHVISIHQVGEDRDVPFLAMPLLKGLTLGDYLKATPRLPLADLLRLTRETAEGLAAAHEKGLVHRDIKPANIWLEGAKQRVKILDFGLARVTTEGEDGAGGEPMTKAGSAVGTPAYMSPEQARGLPVDHRTDLFSLGVLAYQMATGEIPFRGHDVMSVLRSLALEPAVPPMERNPEIPKVVNDLILRMLGKSVDERPASADAIAAEIGEIEHALFRPAMAAPAPQQLYLDAPAVHSLPAAANPWENIDASESALMMPAIPSMAAAVNQLAGPATAPHLVMPVVEATTAVVAPASPRQAATTKGKSGLVLLVVGGVLSVALLGGLAWYAMQMAVGPQGTVSVTLESDVPDTVQIILRQNNEGLLLKPGDKKVVVGDYTVELAQEFRQNYRVSPSRTTVLENQRTELRVRPVAKPRPKTP